jgi:diguanylate cyclase (GGDEF)-like protein
MAGDVRVAEPAVDPWAALIDHAHRLRAEYDPTGAADVLLTARKLAEQAGDIERAVRAELRRGALAEETGDLELRLSAARYALARLDSGHPPVLAAGAHAMLADWARIREDQQATVVELARARALIDTETVGSRELCSAVTYLSEIYLALECHADAHDLLLRTRALCPDVDGGQAAAFLGYWLAAITLEWSEHLAPVDPRQSLARMRECRDHALASRAEATRLDHPMMANLCLIYVGIADATLGAPRRALHRLARALPRKAEEQGLIALGQARAHRMLGDLDACRTAMSELVPERTTCPDAVRRERIQLAVALGDPELVNTELAATFAHERGRRISDGRRRAAAIAAQVELASVQGRISQRDREIATLRDLSLRDPLTRLLNRRGLEDALAALADIEPQVPVGVALIDVDNFKAINDEHSHSCGDAVLRRIGDHLRASTREQDIVARFAGDEFVIVTASSAGCVTVAERFHQAVLREGWSELAPSMVVTVSIGIAEQLATAGLEALIEAADGPLYRAKATGRNRVISQVRAAS